MSTLFSIPSAYAEASVDQKKPPVEAKKLYKVVDKNGKIHYSDQPSPGAKEVDLPEVPSIHIRTPKIKIKSLEEELEEKRDPNASYYSILRFANLVDDSVIRNNGGTATFSVSLEPILSKGHFLKFYIDGKLIQSQQQELSITAQEVTYGPHTASFSVVDKRGSVVQKSETLKFVLLHVVRKNTGVNQNNFPTPFENTAVRAEFFNQNLPRHPQIPTFQALQQAANQSSDN
ncbi:MAG: DUF4124 domain-containing protein [Kangiellaceae bacterium]|nr:DUF4124 domain-containing protein [Kangiellaceae bacterium]